MHPTNPTNRKLIGWTHPLPDYLVKAISDGLIAICFDSRLKIEVLVGETTYPESNCVVKFGKGPHDHPTPSSCETA